MILDDIKKANVEAMKAQDKISRSIYSVLLAKERLMTIEKRSKGQELTDADMVAILQKTIKELGDETENYKKAGNTAKVAEIETQQKICEKHLPQMLSEKQVYDIIAKQADKSIPNIMKLFKSEYAGKCDMRVVQETLKKFN